MIRKAWFVRGALVALACFAAAVPVALAQSSASYDITDSAINAGGRPADGVVAQSASYSITIDSVGDAVLGARLASSSYSMDGGFVGGNPPPGEVAHLRFTSATELAWDAQPASLSYSLYRDPLSGLPANYGHCLEGDISALAAEDPVAPAPGAGWLYLVTGVNRLEEEGTRGNDSSGSQRPATDPCP